MTDSITMVCYSLNGEGKHLNEAIMEEKRLKDIFGQGNNLLFHQRNNCSHIA